MYSTTGISLNQKVATLREYATAIRQGNVELAAKIKNANSKWITATEFVNAKE
jgi:hypothetical protein